MTYAVHSLYAPPVKKIVEDGVTGYRVTHGSRLVPLPDSLVGGECFPTIEEAQEWQFARLREELCRLAPEKSKQIVQWLEDGRSPAAIRLELVG